MKQNYTTAQLNSFCFELIVAIAGAISLGFWQHSIWAGTCFISSWILLNRLGKL